MNKHNQDGEAYSVEDILASFCPKKRFTIMEQGRFKRYLANLQQMSIRVVGDGDGRMQIPRPISERFVDRMITTYDGYDFAKDGGRRIPSLQVANGLPSAEPLPVANVTETLEVVELPRKPAVSKQTLETRDHAVLLLKAKLRDWQYLGRLVTGRHVNVRAHDAIIAYDKKVFAHNKTKEDADQLSKAVHTLLHTLKMKCDGTYATLLNDPHTEQLMKQIIKIVGD